MKAKPSFVEENLIEGLIENLICLINENGSLAVLKIPKNTSIGKYATRLSQITPSSMTTYF